MKSKFTQLVSRFFGQHKTKKTDDTLRVILFSNAHNPTLEISFLNPLKKYMDSGSLKLKLLYESNFKKFDKTIPKALHLHIKRNWYNFQPDLIIFCRYSGPGVETALKLAKAENIKTLMYLDDDLIDVPKELGKEKYQYHSNPKRVDRVKRLLADTDLIYSSTEELTQKIIGYGYQTPIFTAKCFCPAIFMKNAIQNDSEKTFGYMGFGHEADLKIALPSIVALMKRRSDIKFQLFGTIPKPNELDKFGDRVQMIEPIRNYVGFMQKLAALRWRVGICPLADLPFNLVKANTKWVEYSAAGTATLASDHRVYKTYLAENRGVLIKDNNDWGNEIERLIDDENLRLKLVKNAQAEIDNNYSKEVLDAQIVELFATLGKRLSTNKTL